MKRIINIMKLKNTFPKTFRIKLKDGSFLEIPPENKTKIVHEYKQERLHISEQNIDVDFAELKILEVVLPQQEPGVLWIVSRVLAEKRTNRNDLVFPLAYIRNELGQKVACSRLGRIQEKKDENQTHS